MSFLLEYCRPSCSGGPWRRYAVFKVEGAVRVSPRDVRQPFADRITCTPTDGQDVLKACRAEVARCDQGVGEDRRHAIAKFTTPTAVPERGHPAALNPEDNGAKLMLGTDARAHERLIVLRSDANTNRGRGPMHVD